MNPIKKRIYYDSEGFPFFTLDLYGETTVEKDIRDFKILSERNRETFDVIELPYGMYRQDFAECIGYLVDVEALAELPEDRRHEAIRFEYPNPENSEEPIVPDKPLSVQIEELKKENASLAFDVMVADGEAKTARQEIADLHFQLMINEVI